MYATAKRSSIVYSMGITQHSTGTDNVLALANLAMLTGQIGRESTGVNPLRGQNNVQGACDMGALPNVLPGYADLTNEALRRKFEDAWGRKLPAAKGLTVVEILHAAEEGKIRGLYFMGENPGMTDPNQNRTLRGLENVEFMVVQDIFFSDTAKYAHVVLPVASFAEREGTYTNTERRVQRIRKAVPPPGSARSDWEVICDLSTRMGFPMHYPGPAVVMDEIARLTPSYGGISYDRIDEVGLQWPCPTKDHPGTPTLHKEKFTRGLGKFHPTPFIEPAELPDNEYPLILSTGRMLYHYHSGTMTRRTELETVRPENRLEINVEDARGLGIADGDEVQVASRRGSVRVRASVTPRCRRGVVFMTFHFRESPANALTNDALDPVAKIPEFKVCAVKVTKAG
jgi:predicted molibdopterin-dependent oxidoreductase YjgC